MQRIISLVPSLTELLFDLGLESQIVGRTRFCVYPAGKIDEVPIVGGTKNPNIEKIRNLAPDLIILNKEENRKYDADALAGFARIYVSEISTVEEALHEIGQIGELTGTHKKASALTSRIRKLIPEQPAQNAPAAAYLIWKKPWMASGSDTYIHDVMRTFGIKNVFESETRYPEFTKEQLQAKNPELVLLSSEPYPFSEKHISEMKQILPNAKIELVNGEYFSWYGSRMEEGFEWISTWRKQL
ncbi:MAG: helical backbone metal receptor [Balneolales bacterium]|nr:helical backbone metal receptor [Balneolales bacterium]